MDGDYIGRREHEEFRRSMELDHKRLEEENDRQNQRLKGLEDTVKQIAAINTSVEKLALSMEGMLKEQKDQGETPGNLREQGWRDVAEWWSAM